ncbi:hypothetical protein O9992_04410 [Vibrio lentus]|nr:hypothetical protein [Vibrio lentus]
MRLRRQANITTLEAFGQSDMFGVLTDAPEEVEHKYTQVPSGLKRFEAEGERETLGLYLTGHPVNAYIKAQIHQLSLERCDADASYSIFNDCRFGRTARVMTTKRGDSNWFDDPRRPIGANGVMLFSDALDPLR